MSSSGIAVSCAQRMLGPFIGYLMLCFGGGHLQLPLQGWGPYLGAGIWDSPSP